MLNILGHNNVLVAYTSANKAMPVSSCVTIAKQGARYYGDNVYCTVYCGAMLLMWIAAAVSDTSGWHPTEVDGRRMRVDEVYD